MGFTRSETLNNLAPALRAVQAALKPAVLNCDNPFFKSRYADLGSVWESCRELLNKNKLSVAQPVSGDGSTITITTVLLHDSGEFVADDLVLTPVKNDPQAAGSAITYGRRYGLAAMLGIVADEDDDANAATKPPSQPVGADTPPEQPAYQTPTGNSTKLITPKQVGLLKVKCKQANVGTSELCSFLGVSRLEAVQRGDMDRALKGLEAGKIKAAQAEPGALPWEKDEPERLDKTLTEIANCPTREALVKIGKDIKTSEASFSEESISTLRAAYKEREAELA